MMVAVATWTDNKADREEGRPTPPSIMPRPSTSTPRLARSLAGRLPANLPRSSPSQIVNMMEQAW